MQPLQFQHSSSFRCDDGKEYVGVARYMELNRPNVEDRIMYQIHSANSRFRRLWGDVLRIVIKPYKDLLM